MSPVRARVLIEARSWIGTPYRHQMSAKGAGCDCLGLVRGVWRGVLGAEPEIPPAYSPDWAERCGHETLIEAAGRHLLALEPREARPGDTLIFRMRSGAPAKHCAIMSGPGRMIHAWQRRAVCETALCAWWERRIVAAFAFPPLNKDA